MEKAPLSPRESYEQDPLWQRCKTELFVHNEKDPAVTDKVISEIANIERLRFSEETAFDEAQFKEDITHPDTTAILLRDPENGKLAGFTYAETTERVYNWDEGYADREIRPDTAYVSDTAVHPDYGGHKLYIKLLDALDEALTARGFKYVERDSMVENHYAENLLAHYKERVLESRIEEDPAYGPQMFIRMTLEQK